MEKWIAYILSLALTLTGYEGGPDGTTGVPGLEEVSAYTQEQLEERLLGLSIEEVYDSWGEPDGTLFGFWGEIWDLEDDKSRWITLYFDKDGNVEAISCPLP